MNPKNRKPLWAAAIFIAVFLASLSSIFKVPASAAILRLGFCGFFGGNQSSGEVTGFIDIDDEKLDDEEEDFGLLEAAIQTTRGPGLTDLLEYARGDFVEGGEGTRATIEGIAVLFLEDSRYWTFRSEGNVFVAVVPKLYLDNPGQQRDTNNFEARFSDLERARAGGSGNGGGCVFCKDVDKVPEPLSILGTATALGIGALLKKRHSQIRKNAK